MAGEILASATGHKATAMECLIGGVGHKITEGKMLINGVVKKLAFNPTVAWSGTFSALGYTLVTVTVAGTVYSTAGQTTVPAGTTVTVAVTATNHTYFSECYIKLNGTTVSTGSKSYTLTVTSDTSITAIVGNDNNGIAEITTS